MNYEVAADKKFPQSWRVEAIDFDGDGDCFLTVFDGPHAEKRAREYAAWKESGAAQEVSPSCPLCKKSDAFMRQPGTCSHPYHDEPFREKVEDVSPPSPAQPQSLIALQKWERDTGKPASCSEGNAFIDGFNAGFEDKWDAEYRRGKSEAEGDTRELKAALRKLLPRVAHLPTCMKCPPTEQWKQSGSWVVDDCRCGIAEAEKLLG